jgi:hypothetical protein
LSFGRFAQPVANFLQHHSRVVEPLQKRSMTTLFLRRQKLVLSRNAARVLRESVCAKHLTANRTYELSVGSVI